MICFMRICLFIFFYFLDIFEFVGIFEDFFKIIICLIYFLLWSEKYWWMEFLGKNIVRTFVIYFQFSKDLLYNLKILHFCVTFSWHTEITIFFENTEDFFFIYFFFFFWKQILTLVFFWFFCSILCITLKYVNTRFRYFWKIWHISWHNKS